MPDDHMPERPTWAETEPVLRQAVQDGDYGGLNGYFAAGVLARIEALTTAAEGAWAEVGRLRGEQSEDDALVTESLEAAKLGIAAIKKQKADLDTALRVIADRERVIAELEGNRTTIKATIAIECNDLGVTVDGPEHLQLEVAEKLVALVKLYLACAEDERGKRLTARVTVLEKGIGEAHSKITEAFDSAPMGRCKVLLVTAQNILDAALEPCEEAANAAS